MGNRFDSLFEFTVLLRCQCQTARNPRSLVMGTKGKGSDRVSATGESGDPCLYKLIDCFERSPSTIFFRLLSNLSDSLIPTPDALMSNFTPYSDSVHTNLGAAPVSTPTSTSTGDAQGNTPPSANQNDDGGKKKKSAKRRKVNHACLYCRRSHMTCDEGRPCQRWSVPSCLAYSGVY
jgi:Fungal Zn(2)-Cys(6) binuclear cluster domain